MFLAQIGVLAKRKGLKLFEEFRKSSIKISATLHKDSLTSQLNLANKLNVKYSLILGQKEALDGNVIVKEMKTGKQKTIPLDKVINEIKKKLWQIVFSAR